MAEKLGNRGFTLVEAVVVVTIVGVLAAIAIPKYHVFQMNSRMAEAQTNLSGIFAAEKIFFTSFNGFTSSLTVLGFHPNGQVFYNVGFKAATCPGSYLQLVPRTPVVSDCTGDISQTYVGNGGANAMCPKQSMTLSGKTCQTLPGISTLYPGSNAGAAVYNNWQSMTASAGAYISSTTIEDIWQVDQNGVLNHNQDGSL